MRVRISKPAKSAMQSVNNHRQWLLEFVKQPKAKFKEKCIGRTSSTDMSNEVKILFDSLDEAISFAKNKDYQYEIIVPKETKISKKSYASNFI